MLLDKSIKLICVLTRGLVSFSADVLSGRHHYYLGTLRKRKCGLNVVFTIYCFLLLLCQYSNKRSLEKGCVLGTFN